MPLDPEEQEQQPESGAPPESGTLSIISRAEVDVQITTAHRFPRSLTTFKRDAQTIISTSRQTAEECFYTLKRQDRHGKTKIIMGGSIRLAEIVQSCYGNMRSGGRVVDVDDRFVYTQGVSHDLEKNSFMARDVSRRITNSEGRRYGDDMIGTTANAAISIAIRNAVLSVVPRALWWPLYEHALKVARGEQKDLPQRRANMFQEFAQLKVGEEEIYRWLEIKGKDDIDIDRLLTLSGLLTSIRDGEATVEELFGSGSEEPAQPRRVAETTKPDEAATSTKRGKKSEAKKSEAAAPKNDDVLSPDAIKNIQSSAMGRGISLMELKKIVQKVAGTEKLAEVRASQAEPLMLAIAKFNPLDYK
jgi:hypothetical protein